MSNDPRVQLPIGVWDVRFTKIQPANQHVDVATFWCIGTELATADEVRAYIAVDDLVDYTREEWGLPDRTQCQLIWHIGRISPRREKARGGTVALVRSLVRRADRERAWITTEVKTSDPRRDEIVMNLLAKHGGFVSPDLEFATMMIREPR